MPGDFRLKRGDVVDQRERLEHSIALTGKAFKKSIRIGFDLDKNTARLQGLAAKNRLDLLDAIHRRRQKLDTRSVVSCSKNKISTTIQKNQARPSTLVETLKMQINSRKTIHANKRKSQSLGKGTGGNYGDPDTGKAARPDADHQIFDIGFLPIVLRKDIIDRWNERAHRLLAIGAFRLY
ncbi:MAG: hypothetical protein R3D26_19235 [Cyanobacteriota/Melainabacteria group bacterium]